ncbi:MAG: hypothetical protein U0T73_09550 [Chitinophagales bacterium]
MKNRLDLFQKLLASKVSGGTGFRLVLLSFVVFLVCQCAGLSASAKSTTSNRITEIQNFTSCELAPLQTAGRDAGFGQYFECSNEDEQEDLDGDHVSFQVSNNLDAVFDGSLRIFKYARQVDSIKTQLPVPLFILHHSWKSFIA